MTHSDPILSETATGIAIITLNRPEKLNAMPPTFGGTRGLSRLAGRKRALDLLLTTETFSPARSLELGLVSRVVLDEDVMTAACD